MCPSSRAGFASTAITLPTVARPESPLSDPSWVVKELAAKHLRQFGVRASVLIVPDAVVEYYGRAELKAAVAKAGIDLQDPDGRAL